MRRTDKRLSEGVQVTGSYSEKSTEMHTTWWFAASPAGTKEDLEKL